MKDSTSMRGTCVAAAVAAIMLALAPGANAQKSSTGAATSADTSAVGNEASARPRRGADFVNGGITQEEADLLRSQASAYPLEIHFAVGNAFAAGVHLKITNAAGNLAMVLPAADPILLANLPPGQYTVEATYEGQTKRQQVTLGRGHQKLGFQW